MFHAWFVRKSQSMIGGPTEQGRWLSGRQQRSKGQTIKRLGETQMDCESLRKPSGYIKRVNQLINSVRPTLCGPVGRRTHSLPV